ncbi:MAG: L-threonylcarbamoyladenylate synthase [Candidatus Xenobium sp.]|jgi:L-threonylcarbamoyladenylate synthase|nr:threonylcarbamoyl-AMP synthase [Burkholderiales bacterium]
MSTDEEIRKAVQTLRKGLLVAFPTETVYGLGADASNPQALDLLYRVKARPGDHPVTVHLASAEEMPSWARVVPPVAWELAHRFWPGPMTLILPRIAGVSDRLTGGQDTIGLRVPGHPLALRLLEAFGGGLAAPSANRFGSLSPTTAQHVCEDLGPDVAMVLDGGPCPLGVESTILDLSGQEPRLLRPGLLHARDLREVLGAEPGSGSQTRAPGTLARHYSPHTPLLLVAPADLEKELRNLEQEGLPFVVMARRPAFAGIDPADWVLAPDSARDYARELYASLRRMDLLGRQRILVEEVPEGPDWEAIRDRLRRASAPA